MFVRRRRPLARAAMVGGTAYVAGKAGARNAAREQDEEARIAELEAQQAPAAAAAPPAQAPAAGGDVIAQLNELARLKEAGALTQAEFDAAKQQLLAG